MKYLSVPLKPKGGHRGLRIRAGDGTGASRPDVLTRQSQQAPNPIPLRMTRMIHDPHMTWLNIFNVMKSKGNTWAHLQSSYLELLLALSCFVSILRFEAYRARGSHRWESVCFLARSNPLRCLACRCVQPSAWQISPVIALAVVPHHPHSDWNLFATQISSHFATCLPSTSAFST